MKLEQKNNIADKVAKQNLSNLQIKPPAMTFDKVRRKVAWFSFWSLGLGSFVRNYWWTAVSAFIIAFFFINLPKNTIVNAEICTLNNKIPKLEIKKNAPLNKNNQQTHNYNNVIAPIVYASNDDPSINTKTDANAEIIKNASQDISLNSQGNKIILNDLNDNIDQVKIDKQNVLSNTEIQSDALELMPILNAMLPLYEKTPNNIKAIQTPILGEKNINLSVFAGFGASYASAFSAFDSELGFTRSLNPFENTLAELQINVDFGSFFLSSGIKYLTFNDRFHEKELLYNPHEEWNSELQQYWQVDTSSYWQYYYMSDSVVHVIDSAWVTEIDSSLIDDYVLTMRDAYDTIPNAKWQRRICVAELPLMIGKQFTFKNSTFSVSTGLGFALLLSSKGEIYNGPNSVESFSIYSAESKNIAISFLMNVSYEYFITEHLSLQFMPYFRKSLNSIISSPESEKLKPWSAGISGGIRYYF